MKRSWRVLAVPQVQAWYDQLPTTQRKGVAAAVTVLRLEGPLLSRPYADTLDRSKYRNLKELRPSGAARYLRIVFIFDPKRQAILLVSGDKEGRWSKWYPGAIRQAEERYEQYQDGTLGAYTFREVDEQ